MLQALERESKPSSRFTAANFKRPASSARDRRGAAHQAAFGNRAVLRMSQPAGMERRPGACSCGGSCKSCKARAAEEKQAAASEVLRHPHGSDNMEETEDSIPHAGDAGTLESRSGAASQAEPMKVTMRTDGEPPSCCERAISAGLFGKDYGAVICCLNEKHSCVNPANFSAALTNATARRIATTCGLEHEDTHHDDVDCTGAGMERPGWRAGKNARSEECTAYAAEAACLTSHLGDCGTDAECTRQITERRDNKRARGNCA